MKTGFVLLLLVLSACAPAMQAAPAAEADVLAVQRQRFDAMVQNDFAALDAILRDDMTYAHSSGVTDTKAQFIDSLRSGRTRYLSIEARDVAVRIHGETALTTGTSRVRIRNANGEQAFTLRFLDVYVRDGGRWRQAAWQSTRLPE